MAACAFCMHWSMPLATKERIARVWTENGYAEAVVGLFFHEWLWYVFHIMHHQQAHLGSPSVDCALAPLPEVA